MGPDNQDFFAPWNSNELYMRSRVGTHRSGTHPPRELWSLKKRTETVHIRRREASSWLRGAFLSGGGAGGLSVNCQRHEGFWSLRGTVIVFTGTFKRRARSLECCLHSGKLHTYLNWEKSIPGGLKETVAWDGFFAYNSGPIRMQRNDQNSFSFWSKFAEIGSSSYPPLYSLSVLNFIRCILLMCLMN